MLQEFLSPISESLMLDCEEYSLGFVVPAFVTDFPDWSDAHLAIIGVCDGRASGKNKETGTAPSIIRKALYQLIKHSDHLKIVDLGDIKQGNSIQDTEFALQEVARTILSEGVIPIILGGSVELSFAQFASFQKIKTNVEASIIAPKINLKPDGFLQRMCLFEPNILFNLNLMGYQSHYVKLENVAALQKMFFEPVRLGVLRTKLNEMEPTLRNSDVVMFDVGAIKQADAPGNYYNNPNGLTSEEACQLAWYSGISEKMRSFGVYEINPEYDYRKTTTKLAAQMIWYFIDGFYHRRGDHPELHSEFLKYRCTMNGKNPDIVFYKSKRTDRWWMEVPNPHPFGSNSKSVVLPCTYADYTTATSGEMPDRFFKALQKMPK